MDAAVFSVLPKVAVDHHKFFLAHLKLFPKRQLVDGVGHVRVVWLRGGTVCGNMEVSWYLRTDR